ncbi:MAG TPA: hypothetical protein VEB20_13125 [Azospirillaceae bacterium]|nr:hypothetical protein [Azospirillaceae bacterium]
MWSMVDRLYGAARDVGFACDHVAQTFPSGRVWLCGAGTHTRELLARLRGQARIEVAGIVDRLAPAIGEMEGLPVVLPSALAQMDFDYVVVAHTSYETEMAAALIEAGLPPARLRLLYSDPAYRSRSARHMAGRLAGLRPGSVDLVVVQCAHSTIVSERALARIADPARTLVVYMGRGYAYVPSTVFPSIDLSESLDALRVLLDTLDPAAVYVSTIIYKNFLGPLVKHWGPHRRVVHELYDYTGLWPDRDLERLFGLNPETMRVNRLAERVGANSVDLNISKRGGPAWDAAMAVASRPYRLCYPLVEAGTGACGSVPGAGADLLYAGFFPSARFLEDFPNAYQFGPLIRQVCEQGGLTAEIYNSAHLSPAHDHQFAEHLANYATGHVRYNRAVPFGELLDRMGGYRFGWLWDPAAEPLPDRRVGVCNRWTGYVAGGLPVLLDSGWDFMAGLVRRFGAGLVLDDGSPRGIADAIRHADRPAMVAGTHALRSYLAGQNESVFNDLATIVGDAPRREPAGEKLHERA